MLTIAASSPEQPELSWTLAHIGANRAPDDA
jgi:hypothetical protein